MSDSPSIFYHFCRSLAVFRLNFSDVMRALALPLIISIGVAILIGDSASVPARLAEFVLLTISFGASALQLHHLVAIGPGAVGLLPPRKQRSLLRGYFLNVLIVIGIATICVLPLALLAADNDPKAPYTSAQSRLVFYTLLSIWSYIFVRFSMLFISHTVDESLSVRLSWRVTAQFARLVIFLAALIPALVLLHSTVIEHLLTMIDCTHSCERLVNNFTFAACFSLFTISLTLAYETIRDHSPFFRATTEPPPTL